MKFYSNGKLLLTGEYLVLEGAKALALPTKYGQNLSVAPLEESTLVWASFTDKGQCWFEAAFDVPSLRLVAATFQSETEGSSELIAETLQGLLLAAQELNPSFLNTKQGCLVKTQLTFPRDWGLGSSSTLIANIAAWAKVDAYTLLWNAFSGSGYDIACAQHNSPLMYQLVDNKPALHSVRFEPSFAKHLYFVHLNQKQNSRAGIQRFEAKKGNIKKEIQQISMLTEQLIAATSLSDFEILLLQHETIVSNIVDLPKVQDQLFSDYIGTVKSLGAWGGDFVLATGDDDAPSYFSSKGYTTVIPFADMVL